MAAIIDGNLPTLSNRRAFTVRCTLAFFCGAALVGQSASMPAFTRADATFIYGAEEVFSLAALPNGKILGGRGGLYYPVFRLNRNGSLDTNFVDRIPTVQEGTSVAVIHVLHVQRDRRMLVSFGKDIGEGNINRLLRRLLPSGELDDGFRIPLNFSSAHGAGHTDVSGVAVQRNGRILLSRDFYLLVDGPAVQRTPGVIRLLKDGTMDESFDPGEGAKFLDYRSGAQVIALQRDGRILLGGLFTNFSGVARIGLVRLEPNGKVELSFAPGGGPTNSFGPDVKIIHVLRGGKILIAGNFTHYAGVPRAGLARLLSNGTLDASFDSGEIGGQIRAIAVQPNRKIIIGGNFTNVQGRVRNGLPRLNSNGTLDSNFDPALPAFDVIALALQRNGNILLSDYSTGIWRVRAALP